tara:strand:+ start:1019 stop:1759 length:741 start_codon:yes stop_codon:yes gene_type:complete
MNSFEFGIESWSVWTPDFVQDRTDSKDLGKDESLGKNAVDLSAFPAMLRRRLSKPGKTALHSILQLKDVLPEEIPTVFSSHYGEVERSVSLLKSLAYGEPLSPTDFSLAVHNAVAGVYSIGRKQHSNMNAISAGSGGFAMGLVEAYGLLLKHDHVLCVDYGSPLPEPYENTSNQQEYPYAIAMLISKTGADQVQIFQTRAPDDSGDVEPDSFPPDQLINFLNKKISHFRLRCGNSLWNFQRNNNEQ